MAWKLVQVLLGIQIQHHSACRTVETGVLIVGLTLS